MVIWTNFRSHTIEVSITDELDLGFCENVLKYTEQKRKRYTTIIYIYEKVFDKKYLLKFNNVAQTSLETSSKINFEFSEFVKYWKLSPFDKNK